MVGKKTFIPAQALNKALNLFWERGYEATSIEDLVQYTGLGRGSLYDTFGDKHSLYLAALDQYCTENQLCMKVSTLPQGPFLKVLKDLFQSYVDLLLADPARRGCFLVNASVELAPSDPEVAKRVQSEYNHIEDVFYCLLIDAQTANELDRTYNSRQGAHFLLGTLISIRVLARAHSERQTLQDIVQMTLSVFG